MRIEPKMHSFLGAKHILNGNPKFWNVCVLEVIKNKLLSAYKPGF